MPSHTFFGVGRYGDAAAVNLAALKADDAFVAKAKPAVGLSGGLYAHNTHFAIQSALMHGDGPTALKMAAHYSDALPGQGGAGLPPRRPRRHLVCRRTFTPRSSEVMKMAGARRRADEGDAPLCPRRGAGPRRQRPGVRAEAAALPPSAPGRKGGRSAPSRSRRWWR
jgi:hypothetical protein